MNERIVHKTFNRKLNVTLIIFFISFLGFICPVSAQWNFIPQITISGPCSSGTAQAEIAAANATISSLFTGLGLPTQSLCESIRQQILAIRISSPEYDIKGKYIGECSVFYTCTACMGSDIVTPGQGSLPGQVNPGDVSINGILEGKPLFTPHQSQAFEEWSSEYKQLLESYGVTSILGNEDKYFKLLYDLWAERFKPKLPPPPPPPPPSPLLPTSTKTNQDPSKVDLSSSSGVVSLLTTEEEQRKRDAWMNDQGLDNLKTIPENGLPELDPIGDLEPAPFWTSDEMIKLYVDAGKFLLMFTGEGEIAVLAKTIIGMVPSGTIKDEMDKGNKITMNTYKKAMLNDVLIKSGGQAIGSIYGSTGKIIYSIAVKDIKYIYKYSEYVY